MIPAPMRIGAHHGGADLREMGGLARRKDEDGGPQLSPRVRRPWQPLTEPSKPEPFSSDEDADADGHETVFASGRAACGRAPQPRAVSNSAINATCRADFGIRRSCWLATRSSRRTDSTVDPRVMLASPLRERTATRRAQHRRSYLYLDRSELFSNAAEPHGDRAGFHAGDVLNIRPPASPSSQSNVSVQSAGVIFAMVRLRSSRRRSVWFVGWT